VRHCSDDRPRTQVFSPQDLIRFTRPSPASVLQATNAGVRRPGYEAMVGICKITHALELRMLAVNDIGSYCFCQQLIRWSYRFFSATFFPHIQLLLTPAVQEK